MGLRNSATHLDGKVVLKMFRATYVKGPAASIHSGASMLQDAPRKMSAEMISWGKDSADRIKGVDRQIRKEGDRTGG